MALRRCTGTTRRPYLPAQPLTVASAPSAVNTGDAGGPLTAAEETL